MEIIQLRLDWIMDTWLVKVIKRVLPLLTAIWMIVDMGLDINQTITYYCLIDGLNGDGEYRNWALKYKNETNGTTLQTISPGYFYTACAVWIVPPVLASFGTLFEGELSFPGMFNTIFRCNIGSIKNRKKCLMLYPVELIGCILFIYILIPYAALKNGIKHVLNEEVDGDKDLVEIVPKVRIGINPTVLPFFKLFEMIGEALPQFILTVVFASHNFPCLSEFDTYANVSIPISIISLGFSLGSLIIGVISGCKAHNSETIGPTIF